MDMARQIKTLDELKQACQEHDGPVEGFILLKGCAKSSKSFQHFPEGIEVDDDEDYVEEGQSMTIVWELHHDISSTYEGFESDEDMLTQTNVGVALENGALFLYD